ncbi:hypothetical protein [Prochlorococcus marinus]|uniref:hypothetical protein n=1 Tax=Prochlorococcus marinus TaxID=1219 RepID=UPI00019009EC|nr:hypothetical protein [Prochlorococcus marinus]EEE40891.1 conserved hypothetical protein [Prochlorococcus marinus str. MIT 9202]
MFTSDPELVYLSEKFFWNSEKRQKFSGVRKAPIEKDNFRDEDTETFIRELIQNALDAKNQTRNSPVLVKLKSFKIQDNDQKNLYKNIFSSQIKDLLELSKTIDKEYKPSFEVLTISDYGTNGIDGYIPPVNYSADEFEDFENAEDEEDDNSDWVKYFHKVGNVGKTSKKGKLGSRNQGKISILSISKIWTILAKSKIKNGDTRFQGKALLTEQINKNRAEFIECDVFFRKKDDKYELNEYEIEIFNKLFQLDKRGMNDFGSDFVLLEAHDLNQEKLICSILQNWAIPIIEGKLEIELNNLRINQYNVENLFSDFSDKIKNVSLEFIRFCVKARSSENVIKYKLKRNLTKKELIEGRSLKAEMFSERISEKEIMNSIFENKIIEIEFQPKIKYKYEPDFDDRFSVFITQKSDLDNTNYGTQGIVMRMEQILWEEDGGSFKTAKTRDDIYVLISSRSKRISELLTYFEVPNHRQFKANIPDFGNPKMPYIKTNAQDNLRLFQQSANKALSFLFDGETQDDPSFLYTLFEDDYPTPENSSSDRKPKKPSDNEVINPALPPIDLPRGKPKALDAKQDGGDLYIFSLPNYDYVEGDLFELIFVPDNLEGTGDPYSEYTPADLDFKKCNVALEEGCEIETDFNKILLRPFCKNFKVNFEGLWPHWDFIYKSKHKNNNQIIEPEE